MKADWFTFAFIRNPWDRMVSLWANKGRDQIHSTFAKRGMGPYPDFNDFVKALCERTDFDIHWVSQAESILIDGQEVPGFIGRYENLKDDWQFIQKKCLEHNLKLPDLERRNSSAHDHYRKYYSPESRDLIAGKYAQDIEAFGYEY